VPESFLVGARLLRFLVARVLDGVLSLEEIRGTLSQVVLAYEGLPSVARARVQGLEMQTLLAAVDEIENRSSRLNVHSPKNSEVLDRAGLTRLRIAAEQALSDQDHVIAKVLLRSLAEQKNASVWPFLQLSKLAVEENQFDEAISYAKSAISKRYGIPNAHYIIGYVLYKRKRYFDSIISLENALQLNPDLAPAARLLAYIKISIGCESPGVLDTGRGESPAYHRDIP
jgi:tetratricopeptide (TPR) repeat protein